MHQETLLKIFSAFSNQALSLIILPTEQCNFRCVYCYENHNQGRMPTNIVTALKQFLYYRITAGDLKYLNLNWFGGEPLLATDIIYDIGSFAKKLALLHKVQVGGGITTNGFLLDPQTFSNLLRLGINYYQISLDGTKECHNLTRKSYQNQDTFDVIWHNLLKLKELPANYTVTLRLHVMPHNTNSLQQLIDDIHTHFGHDQRFHLFLRPIANLGKLATDVALEGATADHLVHKLHDFCIETKVQLKRFGMWNITGQQGCYASYPNNLVIRSDGSINKCTVALDDPLNAVGSLMLDGTLQIDQQKFNQWLHGIKNNCYNSLRCPYFTTIRPKTS